MFANITQVMNSSYTLFMNTKYQFLTHAPMHLLRGNIFTGVCSGYLIFNLAQIHHTKEHLSLIQLVFIPKEMTSPK